MPNPARKPQTQEQRREESERAVLKAAISLFATQGYLRTTLAEVGREAGYTAGLVSHRFGSKEGLLEAVVDHCTTRFLEDQLAEAVERPSAAESLGNFVEIYLKEVSLRDGPMRALYVIMGEALASVPNMRNRIADLNVGARKNIVDVIHRGVESGEFRSNIDVEAAAAIIIGALRGLAMQHMVDPERMDLDKLIPAMRASALSGLR